MSTGNKTTKVSIQEGANIPKMLNADIPFKKGANIPSLQPVSQPTSTPYRNPAQGSDAQDNKPSNNDKSK